MADYIFNSDGHPQGFRIGKFLYGMDGRAVGRVSAERAYRLDGSYVGVLFKNMVVDKPSVSRRSLPPAPDPGPTEPMVGAETRRPIGEPYADLFHLLLDGDSGGLDEEAA
jgi:hypothetical protein